MSDFIPSNQTRPWINNDLSQDVALARQLVAAAQQVSGIAKINADPRTGVATHGPGETVYGIGVARQSNVLANILADDLELEIDIRLIVTCGPEVARLGLSGLADKVRSAMKKCLRTAHVDEAVKINVMFDDLIEQTKKRKGKR